MAAKVAVIPFVAATSGTQTDIRAAAQLGGETVTAAIIVTSMFDGTAGTSQDEARMGATFVGANGVTRSISISSEHGSSKTDVRMTIGDDLRQGDVVDDEGGGIWFGAVTFQADGMDIAWDGTSNPAGTEQCFAICFAGSDIDSHCGTGFVDLTADTTTSISGVGFEADAVFLLCWETNISATIPTEIDHMNWSFGCTENDDTLVHRASSLGEDDGSNSGNSAILFTETQAAFHHRRAVPAGNPGVGETLVNNFGADGFDLVYNEDTAAATGVGCLYLALNFNGAIRVKVASTDSPSGTATFNWEPSNSPGFTPQACILVHSTATAVNTLAPEDGAGHSGIGIAAFTADDEASITFVTEDDAATTNTSTLYDDKALSFTNEVGTVEYEGTLTSFDSAGWNISVTTEDDDTVRKWWYVAFEEEVAGAVPAINLVMAPYIPA